MSNNVRLAILVAALGYFVDVYDLILFSILRTSSLTDLGYSGDELVSLGGYLLNMQMGGFLIGGILWGVIGDKIGRIELLIGSILLALGVLAVKPSEFRVSENWPVRRWRACRQGPSFRLPTRGR